MSHHPGCWDWESAKARGHPQRGFSSSPTLWASGPSASGIVSSLAGMTLCLCGVIFYLTSNTHSRNVEDSCLECRSLATVPRFSSTFTEVGLAHGTEACEHRVHHWSLYFPCQASPEVQRRLPDEGRSPRSNRNSREMDPAACRVEVTVPFRDTGLRQPLASAFQMQTPLVTDNLGCQFDCIQKATETQDAGHSCEGFP